MKYYVMVTGACFGLISLAHFARVYVEGARLASEPFFVLTTIISMGLFLWALVLFKQLLRKG